MMGPPPEIYVKMSFRYNHKIMIKRFMSRYLVFKVTRKPMICVITQILTLLF
jgi:hypothetical protein